MSIAQIETAGKVLEHRIPELLAALRDQHDANGHVLSAVMVTDILAQHTQLLVAGETAPSSAPSASTSTAGSSTCRA